MTQSRRENAPQRHPDNGPHHDEKRGQNRYNSGPSAIATSADDPPELHPANPRPDRSLPQHGADRRRDGTYRPPLIRSQQRKPSADVVVERIEVHHMTAEEEEEAINALAALLNHAQTTRPR